MWRYPRRTASRDFRARCFERGRKRFGAVHIHAEDRARNAHRGEHAAIRGLDRRADATSVELIFLLVHIVNHVNSLRVT